MARELKPYVNQLLDPEACFRRGFQHGALALLTHIASKLDVADRQELARWAAMDLRDWRILGHETAASPYPPMLPGCRQPRSPEVI
jgi:hypothetical protein